MGLIIVVHGRECRQDEILLFLSKVIKEEPRSDFFPETPGLTLNYKHPFTYYLGALVQLWRPQPQDASYSVICTHIFYEHSIQRGKICDVRRHYSLSGEL